MRLMRPHRPDDFVRVTVKEKPVAYTIKKPISGLSFEDIKRIYDNNPNMTLKELSGLTGLAIPFLKKLLLDQTS